jgi:hypothetical protein
MSLSESASAQVQAILQAAETGAAAIKREAEAEAERIRSAAHKTQRADLSGVLEMVASLRSDLDALEARLKALHGEHPRTETASSTRAPKSAPKPPAPAKDEDADAEGARLIALNMALNGEPRATTDKYLAENFSDLSDREALLDEVYASVEG